jgi:hypothetical protein
VNYLKPLLLFGAFVVAGLAWAAEPSTTKPTRACHWDRQTGRMICQRVRAPGTDTPPPVVEPKPQSGGTP